MINSKKYSFKPYQTNFIRLFYREKSGLKKIVSGAKIEHVGSSSVKGLGGKGIIDIALSVPKKDIRHTVEILKKYNYDFRESGGDKERFFFQKIIIYAGNERRVHIHLTDNNSKAWVSFIAVRDLLRDNKELSKEYEQVKKRAVIYAKGDSKK